MPLPITNFKLTNMKRREFSNEAKKAVAIKVIELLENSILDENGAQSFAVWCEDGAVFDDEDCSEECKELMGLMESRVDAVVFSPMAIEFE